MGFFCDCVAGNRMIHAFCRNDMRERDGVFSSFFFFFQIHMRKLRNEFTRMFLLSSITFFLFWFVGLRFLFFSHLAVMYSIGVSYFIWIPLFSLYFLFGDMYRVGFASFCYGLWFGV